MVIFLLKDMDEVHPPTRGRSKYRKIKRKCGVENVKICRKKTFFDKNP